MSNFINESGKDFYDISSELWRKYRFPNNEILTIQSPLHLHIGSNGHRVYDSEGISHYIPKGWIHLCWESREGSSAFLNIPLDSPLRK